MAGPYPDILKTFKDEFGTVYVIRDEDGNLECTCPDFEKDSICKHIVSFVRGKGAKITVDEPVKDTVPLYEPSPVVDEPPQVATGEVDDIISKATDKLKKSGKADKAKEMQLKLMKAKDYSEVKQIVQQYANMKIEENLYQRLWNKLIWECL